MNRAIPSLCAAGALFTLAACAGGAQGRYPSLAIREAERITGTAQPVESKIEAPPTVPVSADLDQRIGRLIEQARDAHATFQSRASGASRTVAAARGARPPADSWVWSQVALADLQALRSGAMTALTDLDELFAHERLSFPGALSPAGQALADARDRIAAWVEEEDRTIARLAGQLPG